MHGRKLSEKMKEGKRELQSKSGAAAIIVSQHLLLWSSLHVLASSIYILGKFVMDGSILTSTILMVISVSRQLNQLVEQNQLILFRHPYPSATSDFTMPGPICQLEHHRD